MVIENYYQFENIRSFLAVRNKSYKKIDPCLLVSIIFSGNFYRNEMINTRDQRALTVTWVLENVHFLKRLMDNRDKCLHCIQILTNICEVICGGVSLYYIKDKPPKTNTCSNVEFPNYLIWFFVCLPNVKKATTWIWYYITCYLHWKCFWFVCGHTHYVFRGLKDQKSKFFNPITLFTLRTTYILEDINEQKLITIKIKKWSTVHIFLLSPIREL